MLVIYDKINNQKMEIEPSDSSTCSNALQSDNVLSLSFISYECVTLEVNDYIDFCAERFWVTGRYTPKQKSAVEWEYNIKMYGIESLIKHYLVIKLVNGDNETEFSYTATAYDHVALVVQSLNSGMETSCWKVGEVVASEYLDISYEGTYCDQGFKKIADLAKVEYWIKGTTVNMCRCEHGEPITLGCGNGLTSLYSDKADNVKFFTRLFPIGSTRNIVYDDYGHTRLQLPGGVKYIDQDIDKFGVVHHYEKEAFAHIYPRRIGKISDVRPEVVKGANGKPFTIYYFKDSSLNFNPNDYEMNGLVKQVSFQDNSFLAGRDFEVNYNDKTKEFEIITQWPYDNDIQLPNEQLCPKVLDEYILWNIKMPMEYYPLAEAEYKIAVEEFMKKQYNDVSVYKAHTDYIYIDNPNINLTLGQRVRLEHSQYFAEGYRNSRITKITRKVVRPTDMDIEISDALSKGALENMNDNIDKTSDDNRENVENVRNDVLQFTQRRYRDAIETMEMLGAALLDNFTNAITPISVQTMQLILGDESLQFILTTSKTTPDSNIFTPNFVFDTKDASRFKVSFRGAAAVYLQHKTLGIESLSSSHTNFKMWRMLEFTSAPLTDPDKSYYLYAKVPTTNTQGAQVFYLSDTAIGINDVSGFYHLLVGVLNREVGDHRSFSALYGFSELTPGRFTTPLISSPDGKTYFDLVKGEIVGQMTFRSGSSGLKELQEWGGVENSITDAQTTADEAMQLAMKKAYTMSLSNSNFSIPCYYNGLPESGVTYPTCKATLYFGTTPTESGIFSLICTGISAVVDAQGMITFSGITDDSAKVIVSNSLSPDTVGEITITKVKSGSSPYIIYLIPSHGANFYREGTPYNATIEVAIYQGIEDITNTLDRSCFVWRRVSGNPGGDPDWDIKHSNIGNILTLSESDLVGDTDFFVFVYGNNGQLLTQKIIKI